MFAFGISALDRLTLVVVFFAFSGGDGEFDVAGVGGHSKGYNGKPFIFCGNELGDFFFVGQEFARFRGNEVFELAWLANGEAGIGEPQFPFPDRDERSS